ncbi:hypothetical protein NPIL_135101 [Nephila pilipes]|uniref:Uncharacterized protein n=1 Tax=Nephila pilipes TaxID=299642 RepID=A0A8X6UDA1_NEPPI|nr:hypothetical protein NPIL_135101 [Nephila pilipes]
MDLSGNSSEEANKDSKKSKREDLTDLSDNDSKTKNSAPPSSGCENENDTVVTKTNPLPASVQSEENQANETEDSDGFTVVSKKKREYRQSL